jgi:hypothetical protein
MGPDRNRSRTLAQRRRKFKELLLDVNAADSKVLRLFPSVDVHGAEIRPQVKKGLQTALRVLLVAAEDGYVNEYELNEYGVGGDSRHRVLPRLCDLRLLVRSEGVSEKGRTKFVHRLSDKGVVLCAAFPRIFRFRQNYVSLIKNCVANKSLASTMLTLYHAQAAPRKNQLLESLRFASDSALNIEHVSEEDLAQHLLLEEAMSTDLQETALFNLAEGFVEWVYLANGEDIAEVRQTFLQLLDSLRSGETREREMVRRLLLRLIVGLREGLQFIRSSDFQVWARVSRSPGESLKPKLWGIALDAIRVHMGDLSGSGSEGLRRLWDKRKVILEEMRKKMREGTYLRIIEMESRQREANKR